ncbi:MAG: four helix bundle protein [Planctomycetota bacterium]|nr:four helix bundle protein [Planctomycetota bacterium]
MGNVKSYRDLKVWNDSVDLAVRMYGATEGFPKAEQFGLTSQLRRAAVSVPSNIAEGEQRGTTADYIRFLRISLGSTGEIDTQLEIARRLDYLEEAKHQNLRTNVEEIRRMLSGLVTSLEAKLSRLGVREEAAPYAEGKEERDPTLSPDL